jgi:hypothetical protein
VGVGGATGGATASIDFGAAQRCLLICRQSTSVRIDTATHDDLKRLAAEFDTTVGNTVALAVRALRQDHIGWQLHTPLVSDEDAWLDAELG